MEHLHSALAELQSISRSVDQIVSNAWGQHNGDDDRPWKMAYDLVFNKNVSSRAFNVMSENGIDASDYYDPDTSYQDDVLAFSSFLSSKVDDIEKMINPPDEDMDPEAEEHIDATAGYTFEASRPKLVF